MVVYLYPVDGAGRVRILEGYSGQVTALWSAPQCGGCEPYTASSRFVFSMSSSQRLRSLPAM